MAMRTRSLRSLVYLAAGVGLLAAIFAAAETLDTALEGACTVNNVVSCSAVAHSGLTTILGLPDAAWGIGGFVVIFVVAGLAEARPLDERRAIALVALTAAGTLLSLYFLYIEVAEIHALCLVCATAWIAGWVAFGGSVALWLRRGTGDETERTPPPGPAPT
jgi:uncharacterized membrane protein